jgi:hypothetical protein
MIGFCRDGYRLEQGKSAHAASLCFVEYPVKSIDLFSAESGGQRLGGLFAGTSTPSNAGPLDRGDRW